MHLVDGMFFIKQRQHKIIFLLLREDHTRVTRSYLPSGSIWESGHFHLSNERIANVGARKENVPPWMMGSLEKRKNNLVGLGELK